MTRYALYGQIKTIRDCQVVLGCVPRTFDAPGPVLSKAGHHKGFADIQTAFEVARRDFTRYFICRVTNTPWAVYELDKLKGDISYLDIYKHDGQVAYFRDLQSAGAFCDSLNAEQDHAKGLTALWQLKYMTDHTPVIRVATYRFQSMLVIADTNIRALGYRVGDLVQDGPTHLLMEVMAVLNNGDLRLAPYTGTPWSEDLNRWLLRAMTDPVFDGAIQKHAERFIQQSYKRRGVA